MRIQLEPPKHLSKTIFFFFAFWVVGLIGMMRCAVAQIAFTSDGMLEDNVLDWEPKIYVITIDSGNMKQLIHHDRGDWAPAWSSDGKQIAFASDRVGPVIINQPPKILERLEIYLIHVRGWNAINLTQHPADDNHPAWSPDGTQIAFTSNRDGNFEIYVMNADGSNPTRLTDHPRPDSDPAWSPDGTQIAFESDRNLASHIFVMNLDGTNIKQITDGPGWDLEPAWSPDGKRIAYSSAPNDEPFDIYIINADSTDKKNLTNSKFENRHPTWAPDGLQIAYSSRQKDDLYSIYVINADGGKRVALVENLELAVEPAWSPKPLAISPNGKLSTLWARIKIRE